jgi:hypothetical protein
MRLLRRISVLTIALTPALASAQAQVGAGDWRAAVGCYSAGDWRFALDSTAFIGHYTSNTFGGRQARSSDEWHSHHDSYWRALGGDSVLLVFDAGRPDRVLTLRGERISRDAYDCPTSDC